MQTLLVVAIVLTAAGYAGNRFLRTLRTAKRTREDGCGAGCGCGEGAGDG